MFDLLAGKRIFIVEDDITNMAVYSVMLRGHGAEVIQDHWNSQTISLLKQHLPVDIILLDLMLRNGVSGYDIFTSLREHDALTTIPVIAVSASEPAVEIPKAKKMGFAGFISKPISRSTFPNLVSDCIAGKKVWISESYKTY